MSNCLSQKDVSDLKGRIYKTRKARINASERLKFFDRCLFGLNTYYSSLLIILSVITLTNSNSIGIGTILITLSVLTFALNTIGMSLQFKDRYYLFKANYIQLDALYNRLLDINCDHDSVEKFNEIKIEYNRLLDSCENHNTFDYYNFLIHDPNALKEKFDGIVDWKTKCILTLQIYSYYYIRKIFTLIIFLSLIIMPFVTSYLVNLIKYLIQIGN